MRNELKIIRFYALDFTSGLRNIQLRHAFPSGCVQNRNKATTPTKSVFRFPRRNVGCNRDISDNCHPVSVFGKAAENAGKFENVTGITVLKGDRYFSEKVLCRFCVPVQARYV